MRAAARSIPWIAAAAVVSSLVVGTPAAALTIHVLGPGGRDGQPLEGASVSLWSVGAEGNHVLLGRAETDADGRAVLPRPGRGRHVLVAHAAGHVRRDLELSEESPGRIEVRLERGARRTLRIRDGRGRPIRRVRITVVPEDVLPASRMAALSAAFYLAGPGMRKIETTVADDVEFELEGYRPRRFESEHGEFTLGGLGPGRHRVLVGAPLFGVQAEVLTTETKTPLVVTLDRTRCRTARVIDRNTGQGIEGAFAAPIPAFVEGPWARIWPAWHSGPDGTIAVGCPAPRRRPVS